jgi:hypothetical protein
MHLRRFCTFNSDSMKRTPSPRWLIGTVLSGTCFYIFLFMFIVDRPLTTNEIGAYMQYKANYLASIRDESKIAIFAGSNGRFSHRCETITAQTGVACANLSIAVGYDFTWQMSRYWPYLKRGDVLYMPLEYWAPPAGRVKINGEAPYIVRHDHAALAQYSLTRMVSALFYFDIRYLFSGIGEMLLQKSGAQRRTSLRSLTVQGDERGATTEKSEQYSAFIQGLPHPSVSLEAYTDRAFAEAVDPIIETARAKGIVVVGGLPTAFDDAQIPTPVVMWLQTYFELRGACFLVLPNLSKYPRSAFYDTDSHLQESAQIAHSARLGPRLAAIERSTRCSDTVSDADSKSHTHKSPLRLTDTHATSGRRRRIGAWRPCCMNSRRASCPGPNLFVPG